MRRALSVHSFAPLPVIALGEEARIQLKAARMWVMLARHNRNPRPVLSALLGGGTAAFCTLMDNIVTGWPDAFTCFAPCASQVSPDEAALLDLLSHAARADEQAAHQLLQDMLPRGERARLWQAAFRAASAGFAI